MRVGNVVRVSGCTAIDADGNVVGKGDMYRQAMQTLQNVRRALVKAGATMRDVVRTRTYVTDIAQWKDVGRAHGEFFSSVRPCATMVEVTGLIDPDMMVEIEVEAVVED